MYENCAKLSWYSEAKIRVEKREFAWELPLSLLNRAAFALSSDHALSTGPLQNSLFLDVNNDVLRVVFLLPEDILSCGFYRGQFLPKT